MTENPYPHLGWNPVPGIPGAVHALREKVQTAARSLRTTSTLITTLRGASSDWEGEAAAAFRDALDDELPRYIENAATSLEKASRALASWDTSLAAHRDLARKYDEAAREQQAAIERARPRREEASRNPDLKLANQQFPTQEEADAATQRLRAAEQALQQATTELNQATAAYDDVLRKARELESRHALEAAKVAGQLDRADDGLAPKEPGWFAKAVDAIGDALREVGQFLLDHIGTIGAIAGLLALLPTPLAPVFAGIAAGASAVSMAKNLANEDFRDALMGQHGWGEGFKAWTAMVGDGLGVLPGVGALARAGGEVGLAAAIARESGETLSLGQKLGTFADEVVPAFSTKALDVATNPNTGRLAYTLAGTGVAGSVVSSLEKLGVLPEDGPVHDGNQAVRYTLLGINAPKAVAAVSADLGELLAGLRL